MNGFRRLLPAALGLLVVTLGSCAKPPLTAYDSSGDAGPAATGKPIGANTAGEACNIQPNGGGLDVYCGSWDQPSATVRPGSAQGGADLASIATTSPWRASLEGSYACGAPDPGTILDGVPAVILSCTQRIGGWPHVGVVAAINGTVYFADGVAPALPPMQRAIGVLSGKISADAAGSATVTASDSALAQRLAAQAYSSGDISKYNSLMTLGSQANQAEDFPSAVVAYRAALALQQGKIGANNPGTLEPMLELALNLSDEAQYPQAASLFTDAQKLVPASSDPTVAAKLAHYQGLDQLNQGHDATALVLLRQAYTRYAALLPAEVLQSAPTASQNAALETISAEAGTNSLFSEQARLNSPITQGALLGVIETSRYEAIALQDLGDSKGSEAEVEAAERIANANDIAPLLLGARLDRTGAVVDVAGGAQGAAISKFNGAIDNFTAALPGSLPVAETELLTAAVEAQNNNAGNALASCREGVTLLNNLRVGIAPALIAPCLDIYAAAAAAAPDQAEGLHGEMFAAAELAQGSVTAREISEASARLSSGSANPKAAAAIRARQDASAKLATLYQTRDDFVRNPNASQANPGETLASIDKQIAAQNAVLQQDDLAVQAAAPNFGQLVQQVVSASDVMHELRPDEGFLGITPTPSHTWLFLLHDGQINVARTNVTGARMAGLVKAVLNSIEPTDAGLPKFDMADAAAIYTETLAPFAGTMGSVHELVVAPSGPLLALPFALLPTGPASADDLANAPWLVRETNLSYVPAAANFVSLRKIEGTSAAPKPWFGFGDFEPVSLAQALGTYNAATCKDSAAEFAQLPHLPYATLELKAAAAVFNATPDDELLGPDFTVPNVEGANLKNYRILHFATHALLPTDLPCQNSPAIVTSAPIGAKDANLALLSSGDVTNLKLDANLVILSACNTGGGEAGGEALSGLARSFFYAGARALMVTQWSVNDQVSAYLVADTLSRFSAGADGGAAGSLRAAQLALINDAGKGMAANIADPFFWAAFAVIGDGGAAATKVSSLNGNAGL